jgi:hypothetical protein
MTVSGAAGNTARAVIDEWSREVLVIEIDMSLTSERGKVWSGCGSLTACRQRSNWTTALVHQSRA